MKNLGKQEIVILVNGAPNGKTVKKTVYEYVDGTLYVNDLRSKKQVDFVGGEYRVNYQVKAIRMMTGADLQQNLMDRLNGE